MKKIVYGLLLAGTLGCIAKPLTVKTVSTAAKSITINQEQKQVVASNVVGLVKSLCAQGKEHYLLIGSTVTFAGIVALYYTNEQFKKTVQGWLGLIDETVAE